MIVPRVLVRLIAVPSILVGPVVVVLEVLRDGTNGATYAIYAACAISFMAVGWLIAERQPANAVGPLLLSFGALFAWYIPADLYLRLPGRQPWGEGAALFASVLDAPMFILIAFLLLLFPDGRVPSARWRWAVGAGVVAIGSVVVGYSFNPGPLDLFPLYSSPFAIASFPGRAFVFAAYAVMLALLLLAAVALVGRWRRGEAVQRAQIKWVAAAAVVLLVIEVVNVATFRPEDPTGLIVLLGTMAIALVPIAIGIAVLRYRLYAIDRIVSRTIAYAAVSAVLVGAYTIAILVLQGPLGQITGGETVTVAISTLLAAILFQPLRRRIQALVDQRFDRARFDSERMTHAFSTRLRAEVDIAAVTADLDGTVRSALKPAFVGLWLRNSPE